MVQWENYGDLVKNIRKLTNEELDEVFLKDMREALITLYNQNREGYHVSDITSCIRKKIFNIIDPVPLTNREVNWFQRGRSIGNVIQELAQTLSKEKYTVEKEVKSPSKILEGHVDLYNNFDKLPIELKTAAKYADELILNGPSFNYILQIAIYMALNGDKKGLLYFKLILQRSENFDHGYEVKLSDREIDELIYEVERLAKNLKESTEKLDPKIAEFVAGNPNLEYQCEYCPYAIKGMCNEGLPVRIKLQKSRSERYRKKTKDLSEKNKGILVRLTYNGLSYTLDNFC
ncbi:MAG: hypothetical protein R3321_04605 [Nitrososphaeraceae archaeon]|nr:hypothetical protein [Nitrososphaeraceae archaeon]